MKKEKYGIMFDSDIEIIYFEMLTRKQRENEIISFMYQPKVPIMVNSKSKYTPDFIVEYEDKIEIIELKGYNPYSKLRDDMIHNFMLYASQTILEIFIVQNGFQVKQRDIFYKKLKYLQAFGFVNWDFKNPNTLANKRRTKIAEQSAEIKDLKQFKQRAERYFNYLFKIKNNQKLTRPQQQWLNQFEEDYIYNPDIREKPTEER